MRSAALLVRNMAGERVAQVENAESLWGRFLGLMGRRTLAPGGGLWLPGTNGIHMLFMRFPIDAVFVGRPDPDDRSRPVVGVRAGLRPWTGVVWYVRGAHGVLELPLGAAAAAGIAIGDRLTLETVAG